MEELFYARISWGHSCTITIVIVHVPLMSSCQLAIVHVLGIKVSTGAYIL